MTILEDAGRTFVMLTAVIDPLGTLAVFLAITRSLPARERRSAAMRSILVSTLILVAFIIVGQILLHLMGIRMESFQIAGGIILFLFGLKMIFDKGEEFGSASPRPGHDLAIFPLALPTIASPGAIMAVVLLTDGDRHCISEQVETTILLIVVLAITLAILLMAGRIHRLIGDSGANIAMRVMGLVLSALATETVIEGVLALLKTQPA